MKSVKSVLLITCILFVIKTDPVDSFKLLRHKRQTNGSPIPSRCLHMPDSGMCLARYVNYYYNSATGDCETFVYGGCGGNDNNFWSMHDCEVACKNRELNEGEENDFQLIMESLEPLVENKDDCEYPPETGECEAIFMRYYFNGEKCETFVYGGCGGNPNNFETEEGCIERCIIKPTTENVDEDIIKLLKESFAPLDESKDVCEYPPVTGVCRALFRNYYFNGEKCEIFIYGGCGGNPNNFRTEEECIERCMPASETENSEENEI